MIQLIGYLPLAVHVIAVLLGLISGVTLLLTAAIDAIPRPWRDVVVKRWPWTRTAALGLRTIGTHATAFLGMLCRAFKGEPIHPEDASAQAAAFLRKQASVFKEIDPRRMALEYAAEHIDRGAHLSPPAPNDRPRGGAGFFRVKPMQRLAAWTIGAMLLGSLLLALSTLASGCTPAIRQQAINVGNAAAHVSNTETTGLLTRYCRAQMQAIGHPAAYADGSCRRTDATPAASASPDQAAALAAVRAQWAPVLAAHERVVRAQNALAGALNAADAVTDSQFLSAISELASAYEDLRVATRTVGFEMPAILSAPAGGVTP